jgi:hypothetical protein
MFCKTGYDEGVLLSKDEGAAVLASTWVSSDPFHKKMETDLFPQHYPWALSVQSHYCQITNVTFCVFIALFYCDICLLNPIATEWPVYRHKYNVINVYS